MSSQPPFPSEVLRASARGYASLVAERLFDEAPAALETTSFASWRETLESWIVDLGAALADGVPESFVRQMEWTRWALRSRGIGDRVLRDVLGVTRDVLGRELPDEVRPAAEAALDEAAAAMEREPAVVPPGVDVDAPHGRLAARYVVALLEGDRRGAQELVVDAVEQGTLDVVEAFTHVLAPAQRELGRMWHLNEGSVAEEHFVTSTTVQVMTRLTTMAEPREANGKVVVATSVGGDLHGVGVQMVADLFELDGWRVVFLGANVPAGDVGHAARDFEADLVVISATLANQRRDVAGAVDTIRAVADERGRACPVLVGGAAFDGPERLWRNAGADGTAGSAHDAVVAGRRLVGLDD